MLVALLLVGLILIGITASIWIGTVTDMSPSISQVEYEHINSGDTSASSYNITGDNMALQTFTASSSHYVTAVKLKVWVSGGSSTSTFTLQLYNADVSGDPTGSYLAYGTCSLSGVITAAPGEWVTVNMNTSYHLTVGHDYDIVLSYTPHASESLVWRLNSTSAPSNHFAYSTDSGATWNRA